MMYGTERVFAYEPGMSAYCTVCNCTTPAALRDLSTTYYLDSVEGY